MRPENSHALERSYGLAAGRLRLDLRAVHPGVRSRSVSASVSVGVIQIVVPDDVTVRFDGRVSAGRVCTFGRRDAGTGNHVRDTLSRPANTSTLDIHARVGIGEIHIGRSDAEASQRCG